MELSRLNMLISEAASPTASDIPALQELVKSYPYFSSAKMLLIKALHHSGSIYTAKTINQHAISMPDRKALFALLQPKTLFAVTPVESNHDRGRVVTTDQQMPPIAITTLVEPIQPTAAIEPAAVPNDPQSVLQKRLAEIFADKANQINTVEESVIPLSIPTREGHPPVDSPPLSVNTDLSDAIYLENNINADQVVNVENNNLVADFVSVVDSSIEVSIPGSDGDSTVVEPVEVPANQEETFSRRAEGGIALPDAMLDAVEQSSYIHALEDELLKSLEQLPAIPEAQNILPSSAPSSTAHDFSYWLRQYSLLGYGKFDEVKADDETALVNPSIAKPYELPIAPVAANEESRKLIDKFIIDEPRISPVKTTFFSPTIQAKRSLDEAEMPVSETLAGIMLSQGFHLKARMMYEKLILFYPEKKTFFAAQINSIDQILNSSK